LRDVKEHQAHVQEIKSYMIAELKKAIPGVEFNGACNTNCLYTVLNVRFPHTKDAEMLLFNLDIAGIAVSGGSACSSGSDVGSHVLRQFDFDLTRPSVRFSFSKYNTKQEVDYTISKLKQLFN
jgi:cysteine desulfurase